MKRFQECNWVVKLWRYRHYVYIPFRYMKYKLQGRVHEDLASNSHLWGILVGSAQCDMKWTYTWQEVMKRQSKTK